MSSEMTLEQQALYLDNEKMIPYCANRFKRSGIEWDDLITIARIGLIQAAKTYSPEKGQKFSSYAAPCMINGLRQAIAAARSEKRTLFKTVSIDETLHNGGLIFEGISPHDVIPCEDESIENIAERRWQTDELLRVLSDREREIVSAYYKAGLTQKEIATETGISRQRVHAILERALTKMREAAKHGGN